MNNLGRKYRILIVDDTPEVCTLISTVLTIEGYHVTVADGGEKALFIIDSNPPDLILLDILMPGMNGYQVCKYLKTESNHKDIPIIFLSALSEIEDVVKGFNMGAVDYIKKPVQSEELIVRINTQLTLRNYQNQLKEFNINLEDKIRLRNEQLVLAYEQIKFENDERNRLQNGIKTILNSTSYSTGLEYFNLITKKMCEVLEVDFCFVGRLETDTITGEQKINIFEFSQIFSNLYYPIEGTPSQILLQGVQYNCDKDVQTQFPKDILLHQLEAVSYWAVPLVNSDCKIIGIFGIVVRKPMILHDFRRQMLSIFSMRTATEMERIEYDKQLIASKQRAEDESRLKTIFLSNLSHEIRTPMNAIVGFIDLAMKHGVDPEKKIYFMNVIKYKSFELLDMITKVLDASIVQNANIKLHLAKISFAEIVNEINQRYSKQKIQMENYTSTLNISISDEILNTVFITDHHAIVQILTQLIDNAFKFTVGGDIDLGFRFVHNRTELEIYVKDTGIGIDDTKRSIIFDIFRQVDEGLNRTYSGLGVGLAVAKGYAEALGGNLTYESRGGYGTTFYCMLPLKM